MKPKDIHEYDDIIHLPHPDPAGHPRMSLLDRAAQFSPFSALSGHDLAVKETERLTEGRSELEEDAALRLNEKLQELAANPDDGREVEIAYFVPDEKKSGGKYVTLAGIVKKINRQELTILMADGTLIPMDEIREINLGE